MTPHAHRPGGQKQQPFQTDGSWPPPYPGPGGDAPLNGRHRVARRKGGGLLAAASCLLLLLAAAQGYVSFRAQYTFVDHAKRAHVPSVLEALGLDTGAVIFALLALSLARRGRRGAVERVLNVACALGSLSMNLLAANLTSPRSVTVWVLPSVLYALASDRLIAVVRRWVQASDPAARIEHEGSAWRGLGGLGLWVLRLTFDPPGTVAGFRRWVLAVAPVAPGVRAGLPRGVEPRAPAAGATRQGKNGNPGNTSARPGHAVVLGETKREALIRLYERCGETGDPRYGERAKTAQLAGEIAGRIGYHAGTARRELARYVASQSAAAARPERQTPSDAEAVA
jgi:hypothetical protein